MTMHKAFQPRENDIDELYVSRKDEGEDPPGLRIGIHASIQGLRGYIKKIGLWFMVCWVLWHINLCRLFNDKSIFM